MKFDLAELLLLRTSINKNIRYCNKVGDDATELEALKTKIEFVIDNIGEIDLKSYLDSKGINK